MSKKPSSSLASDPDSLCEVQRRQLAENLGYLLAREWLRRRTDSRPKPGKPSSPEHNSFDGGGPDRANSAGKAQSALPATME
jgi:hypothetical protein